MAGKQWEIYQNYVKRTTANNVKPTRLDDDEARAFLRENGIEFDKPTTYTTKYFDGGHGARVWDLKDGRVVEYAPGAFGRFMLAVFDRAIDHVNYRRPMGMFHYLHT